MVEQLTGSVVQSHPGEQNWEYRIAAIPEDCKSSASASVVRVHLLPHVLTNHQIVCIPHDEKQDDFL